MFTNKLQSHADAKTSNELFEKTTKWEETYDFKTKGKKHGRGPDGDIPKM